jgi:hypothetical protein
MAQLSAVQVVTHATLHQLIDGMNPLAFNPSNARRGRYIGCGYGSRGRGRGRMQGRCCSPPAYVGGIPQGWVFPQEGFPPTMSHVGSPMGAPHGPLGQIQGGNAGSPPPYHAPPATNGRYGPTGGYGMPPGHPGMSPRAQETSNPIFQCHKTFCQLECLLLVRL